MKKIKLGIVGMSQGNGHPYSWAAICNGYNKKYMQDCPFPVIPDYLSKEKWPDAQISDVEVTHIWTQKREVSEHIAKSSLIENIVDKLEDMIQDVDGVLLARDDAENHFEMSLPFLEANKPVFIDKPFALSVEDARNIWNAQQSPNQVFTCSSLRFAEGLLLSDHEKDLLGNIKIIEGSTPKKWETYGIHILEPAVSQIPNRGKLIKVNAVEKDGIKMVQVQWENLIGNFRTSGKLPIPYSLTFHGTKNSIRKSQIDTFSCFKTSIEAFINVCFNNQVNIPKEETLELVEIIEKAII